eukprot:COSAG01_NODE_181_length_22873_cov_12.951392_22_plen_514_part_00
MNGTYHFMNSCGGGWCHLSTLDLVHYDSHGLLKPGGGTGSVAPLPDGSGIGGWHNDMTKHMVSHDGMMTWADVKTTTTGSPGGRDQARPLQSSDGSWFQMMGCGTPCGRGPCATPNPTAAVCRFKATDTLQLTSWEFDGFLFSSNRTLLGQKVDFFEVPDFYPLTNEGGITKHILIVDPWGSNEWNSSSAIQPLPTPPASYDPHVHNVEWIAGTWSADGAKFEAAKQGLLDFGWWYAARSVANVANTGRRLMSGNIGTDVVHSGVNPWVGHEKPGLRFFNALPRDVSLAADGVTVHVRPPRELQALRFPTSTTIPEQAMWCGQHIALSTELRAAEFLVRVNVSELAADVASVGLYLLASTRMEEAVTVGVNASHVFVDTRNSTQNTSLFQDSFRTVLTAPVPAHGSGVVALHVFLDETVIELFVSDCICSGLRLASCDCHTSHSKEAIALTALAFPLRASATHSGLATTCTSTGSTNTNARVSATVWPLQAIPVRCTPPCTPPETETSRKSDG